MGDIELSIYDATPATDIAAELAEALRVASVALSVIDAAPPNEARAMIDAALAKWEASQ